MKLDRNLNKGGKGKYALLNLRKLDEGNEKIVSAIQTLVEVGVIEWGVVGEEDEFFVIKLKDINADAGLNGYAEKARETDVEWANEVKGMISRAGINSKFCKIPD